jgi:hypothetical protein
MEFEEVKQHWPIIVFERKRQVAALTLLYPSNDPHNTYRIDTARHKGEASKPPYPSLSSEPCT